MGRTLCLSCWLAIAVSPAVAQPAAPPPAAVQVQGRVVAALNDAPLPRVRVAAGGGRQAVEPVFTDALGRFVLTVPGPGYSITMTKAGYAALTLAAGSAELRPGRELEARLAPGAVITGRVLDASGLPAALVPVQARRTSATDGNAAIDFRTETDDLGDFRLGALPEGRYAVTVGQPPVVRPGFAFDIVTRVGSDGIVTNTMVDTPSGTVAPSPGLGGPPPSGQPSLAVTARAGQETGGADFMLEPSAVRLDLAAPRDDGGTVRGRVLGPAGEPLSGATVALQPMPGVITTSVRFVGDDGVFEFANVQPGEYRVHAARLGYVALEHGQRAPAEIPSPISVTGAVPREGVDISLPRGSVITGAVVDENGEPLEGVPVGAMQLLVSSGGTTAVAAGRTRLTDDRGQFRLFGFPPGDYIIAATVDTTIYAPGSADIDDAQLLRLGVSEDAAGIGLVFTPVRTVRIEGTARRSSGQPAKGNVRLLRSRRSTRIAPQPRSVPIAADGSFSIANVTRGEYVIQVLAEPGPGTSAEFMAEIVGVTDREPAPLSLRTAPAATLSGRVTVEGDSAQRPDTAGYTPLPGLALRLVPADHERSPVSAAAASLAVQSDGSFYITQLWGPGRLALMSAPDGWYLRSISVAGVDLTDSEFDFGYTGAAFDDAEIVLSRDGATVTGRAATERSDGATGYSVIVFAADPRRRIARSQHIKYARASSDGSFRIAGLAPGPYFAAAVDRLDAPVGAADWDPAALDRLAERATRITLRERETRTLNLRLPTP